MTPHVFYQPILRFEGSYVLCSLGRSSEVKTNSKNARAQVGSGTRVPDFYILGVLSLRLTRYNGTGNFSIPNGNTRRTGSKHVFASTLSICSHTFNQMLSITWYLQRPTPPEHLKFISSIRPPSQRPPDRCGSQHHSPRSRLAAGIRKSLKASTPPRPSDKAEAK